MPEENFEYEEAMDADYEKELDDRKEEAEEILANTKKTEKLIKKVRKLCTKLSRIPVIGPVIGEFGIRYCKGARRPKVSYVLQITL